MYEGSLSLSVSDLLPPPWLLHLCLGSPIIEMMLISLRLSTDYGMLPRVSTSRSQQACSGTQISRDECVSSFPIVDVAKDE